MNTFRDCKGMRACTSVYEFGSQVVHGTVTILCMRVSGVCWYV